MGGTLEPFDKFALERAQLTEQLRTAQASANYWRDRALKSEEVLRKMRAVENYLTTIDTQEGEQPRLRQSDFHCVCGRCCVTDGSYHWCSNNSCKHCGKPHKNV